MAFTRDHSFLHKKLAYNYRMTAMQGAVALAQTERLDEILATRREIEARYDAGLKDLPGITLMLPATSCGCTTCVPSAARNSGLTWTNAASRPGCSSSR